MNSSQSRCEADAHLNFDVIISGYGPGGATLAHLLGSRGLRVAVLDLMPDVYDKPRAITADHEVLRVFQECGVADAIAAVCTPHPGTDFIGLEGQIIKRFYPQSPPFPLSWEPAWMFVQPELETTLRAGLRRYPHVREFLEHQYLDCIQDADGVTARVRRLSDGAELAFRARYLVAADGGRSTVRREMGAVIEDLAFDEWWIVVDAWLRGPTELPPRSRQYCQPARPGTYMQGPGLLRRWEIKLLPGESPDDFQTEAAVRKVLSTFVDPTNLELCRSAVYRFHALVLERWRFDRVFLLGDAAHQTPPFLGQGLCAAVRDAANLAWKIHGVERLGYTPALLDSYGDERKPHVRTVVAHAKDFGLIIGELDEAAARRRDAELGALLASGRAETVRQKFIPGLEGGVVARQADGTLAPGAGQLFVQPFVHAPHGALKRLDDLAPATFLLASGAPLQLDAATAALWQRLGGRQVQVLPSGSTAPLQHDTWVEQSTLFTDWLASFAGTVAVVRPHLCVFGIAREVSDLCGLVQALARVLGLVATHRRPRAADFSRQRPCGPVPPPHGPRCGPRCAIFPSRTGPCGR